MTDARVMLATAAARKLVDAINFPLLIQIPAARAAGLGQADIEVASGDASAQSDDNEVPEISQEFEQFIATMAQRAVDGTLDGRAGTSEQLAALKTIGGYLGGNKERALYGPEADEVKAALAVLVTRMSISVEVQWVKVELDRPTVTMANPIVANQFACRVQARVRACLKLYGKKVCVSVTSPRIRLEARAATFALSAAGARVLGQPSFNDLDIVIKIRIWKWTYSIRIGVTSLVNEQLRKQGPIQIADLGPLEQGIPYSGRKLAISSLSFADVTEGLGIDAVMQVK